MYQQGHCDCVCLETLIHMYHRKWNILLKENEFQKMLSMGFLSLNPNTFVSSIKCPFKFWILLKS